MTATADGYTPDGGQMISQEKNSGNGGRARSFLPEQTAPIR